MSTETLKEVEEQDNKPSTTENKDEEVVDMDAISEQEAEIVEITENKE